MRVMMVLLGILGILGSAWAGPYVALLPPPLSVAGIYVHAGSEGNALDPDGNVIGRCVYWSNPIRAGGGRGGRIVTLVRFVASDCAWTGDGTLLYALPVTALTAVQAFAAPNAGMMLDDDHMAFAADGIVSTGRTLSTNTGFVTAP